MTNAEILRIAMAQSAREYNCAPEDFCRAQPVATISRAHKTMRAYYRQVPFFCNLISYGNNAVASADIRVRDGVAEFLQGRRAHDCFESPDFYLLNAILAPYGQTAAFQNEYWLPDVNALRPLPCPYETRLLGPAEFAGLYTPRWQNALCAKRPQLDTLGAGAYDGGDLIGLAACSADCETMWQIGVDVLPPYRRRGIAAALTARLALEILDRGKAPFYCCAWANLASARGAFRGGFRPAWAELICLDANLTKLISQEGEFA